MAELYAGNIRLAVAEIALVPFRLCAAGRVWRSCFLVVQLDGMRSIFVGLGLGGDF